MSRRILRATKCCQMTNAKAGTGSGGDRCTEACGAIIATTYKIGPHAQAGDSAEQIMYAFTEWLNNGSDNSVPENASWIGDWLRQNSSSQITLGDIVWPGFQDVINCINRGHIAIGGFDDYASLRLVDGSNPYQWTDPPGLGHVLIIVGYDTDKQAVIVHDPLRADPDGQPADYSWTSFQAAKFHDLIEVNGPALPGGRGKPMGVPVGWTDDGASLTAPNGVKVSGPFRAYIMEQGWDSYDWPLDAAQHLDSLEEGNPAIGPGTRQDFRLTSLAWADNPPPQFPALQGQLYIIWLGQDRLALKQQVAQLQAKLQQAGAGLDVPALKADAATVAAALAPLEAQISSLQGAEQAIQDIEKKLGN